MQHTTVTGLERGISDCVETPSMSGKNGPNPENNQMNMCASIYSIHVCIMAIWTHLHSTTDKQALCTLFMCVRLWDNGDITGNNR